MGVFSFSFFQDSLYIATSSVSVLCGLNERDLDLCNHGQSLV